MGRRLGGVTFAIDGGTEFVKVCPDAEAHLPAAEVPRLRWARRYAPVLLDAYGVRPDVDRIAYYRRAWDEDDPQAG